MGAQSLILSMGVAPVFNPTTISGLVTWQKADGLTGLANNAPVSSFTDFSGNARHATATLTARPLWIENAINGLPIVRFDGINDVMLFPTIPANLFVTGFFVVKSSNLTSGRKLLATVASGTITGVYHGGNDVTKWQTRNLAGTFFTFGTLSDTVFQILTTQQGFSSNYGWALGGRDGTDFLACDLAEMLIYDSVISAPNVASVQSYLGLKYNL